MSSRNRGAPIAWVLLAGLNAGVAACASNTPTLAADPSMRTLAVTDEGTIRTTSDVAEQALLAGPADKVFGALLEALRDVGIEPSVINVSGMQAGTPGVQRTVRLGTEPLTSYFECGSDMTGQRASRDRLTIAVSASVSPAGRTNSYLRTRVTASSRNMMGNASDAVSCGSTGRLEKAIRLATELRLAKP